MPLDDRTDVTATPVDIEETQEPSTYLRVEVDDATRLHLEAWVKDHVTRIEREMQPILDRFTEERNQYDGTIVSADYPYPGAFRVNYPLTKRKVREMANRAKQAFLDSEPIWALADAGDPRLLDLSQRLEKALDDAARNLLDLEVPLATALFESIKHGVGFLSKGWDYQEDRLRTVETYPGFDGTHPESLQGLQEFERRYPKWKEERVLRRLHASIARGETRTEEFTYDAPTRNRPLLFHVPVKEVRVYPETEGFEGLRSTPLYGYVRSYSHAQMERFVREQAIDESAWLRVMPGQPDRMQNATEEQEPHEVLHATIRYELASDQAPATYTIWYEVRSGVVLRLRAWPWWLTDPSLIPLYSKEEEPGFFKRGFAWDLKDDHVILTVLTNMLLNGIDLANSMRFKAKEKSPGYGYLLGRQWSPHLPIPYRDSPDEVIPMNSPVTHLEMLVESIELMRRSGDEQSGTSSLQSGRESPTDPRAPATKSLLLLQQVEPNLKEILRSLSKGLQSAGKAILWLYYQALKLGWIAEFPGMPDLPHDMIPDLAEQLQPRALLFEFDRVGRAERNALGLQLVEKYAPKSVPIAAKLAISQLDSQWARIVNQLDFSALQPPQAPPSAGGADRVPSGNGSIEGGALGGALAELAGMTGRA